MTDYVTVKGVQPYDGRYELPYDFSTREWGWIKRLAGYMPLTLEEGFRGGDPELFSVFAIIGMHRDGKIAAGDTQRVFDRLADVDPLASIAFEAGQDEEAEAGDADPSASSNGKQSSSGADSTTSSETSAADPKPSGTPAWVTSGSPRPPSGS